MTRKRIQGLLFTVILSIFFSFPAFAGWYQNESGTWFYWDDAKGENLTDFQYIDGKFYFFNTNRSANLGAMLTGLQLIGCRLYYLNPDDGGAAASNMDYAGYHFGPDGCAVKEDGESPMLWIVPSYETRVKAGDKMMVIPAVNTAKEPAVTDNEDVLAFPRRIYPGSFLEKIVSINLAPWPQGQRLVSRIPRDMEQNFVDSKSTTNAILKLEGRELAYPGIWGPNTQYIYDWFVELFRSYDWENASEYERAYHLYEYLAKKYDYGKLNSDYGSRNDFEDSSIVAWQLASPTMVCEDFTNIYMLAGSMMGLNVGHSGYEGHIYPVVMIDGVPYAADSSGYAKYGKAKPYFGVFDETFFYKYSTDPTIYNGEEIWGPLEN